MGEEQHRHLRNLERPEIDRPFIYVTHGLVSAETLEPFVQTRVILDGEQDPLLAGQITIQTAIVMGVRMIQTAVEAELDSGMIRYLRGQGMHDDAIAQVLNGIRTHRRQWDAEHGDIAFGQPDHQEPEPE